MEDIVVEEVPEEVRGYEYFDLGTWIKVVVERDDDYADIGYKTQDEQTLGSGTASTPDDEKPISRLLIVYGISLSLLVTVSVLFCCIGLANACRRKNRTENYTFSRVKGNLPSLSKWIIELLLTLCSWRAAVGFPIISSNEVRDKTNNVAIFWWCVCLCVCEYDHIA